MQIKPNLFKHAVSELAQDAFLCWLIEWAHPDFDDNEMHLVAIALLKEFYTLFGFAHEQIYDLNVKRQHSFHADGRKFRLDILITVNKAQRYGNSFGRRIMIEDKVEAMDGPEQLANYTRLLAPSAFDMPVYFKTGNQTDFSPAQNVLFKPFLRSNLLQLFYQHRHIENAIFQDFFINLERMEHDFQSFKTTPTAQDWSIGAWQGFFDSVMQWQDTSSKLKHRGKWSVIQYGNAVGFWWGITNSTDVFHIGLEKEKLFFLVDCNLANEKCYDRDAMFEVMHKLFEGKKISGKQITVKCKKKNKYNWVLAELRNYCVTDADGLIDMAETMRFLKQVETEYTKIIADFQSTGRINSTGGT